MKLFVNTADVEIVRRLADFGVIDGVTTNPTVMAGEGKDFRKLLVELGEIVGIVHAQVTSREAERMVVQALELSSWSPNIVVKIPALPEGFKAMARLQKRGVPVTATLVYTPTQALLAAKLGARYVASFVKRQDAIANSGIQVVERIVKILRNYRYETQVLAAGLSNHLEVVEAALVGADAVTVDPPFYQEMMTHPMSAIGESSFLADWAKYMEGRRAEGLEQEWMKLLA